VAVAIYAFVVLKDVDNIKDFENLYKENFFLHYKDPEDKEIVDSIQKEVKSLQIRLQYICNSLYSNFSCPMKYETQTEEILNKIF